MDTQHIIETVQNIFIGVDMHNWGLCLDAFDERVYLDYTSFAGGEASEMQALHIVDAWKSFLPLFKCTHHQLGNFTVEHRGQKADVFFYGTATHYFPNESGQHIWTVVGTYDASLHKVGGKWKVNALTLNFKYQDGNLKLPELVKQ
jgi:hypothetical protein